MSINKVILLGRLGQDPKISNLQNGNKIASFNVATSESWKDKATGEKKERTEWHSVVIFNSGLVGLAEKYLVKGDQIYIEGQLQTRKWEDSNGVEKYKTEVVLQNFNSNMQLLGGKKEQAEQAFDEPQAEYDLNDDIPF